MIPRGRLDISWLHLAAGLAMAAGWRPCAAMPSGIVGSSVRSLWGCTLDALNLPAGSRVGITSPTVPGMVARITERQLIAVPMPLTRELTLPDAYLQEPLSAVLVAHLFGVRLDLEHVAHWCRSRGIPLIEDCAQAWDGHAAPQHATVRLTSFGMIKRCTALGGALAIANDPELHAAIAARASTLTAAPASRMQLRVIRAAIIQALATHSGTSVLHAVARAAGRDPDVLIRTLIRAQAPSQEAQAARLGLHPAERSFLAWRLERTTPDCTLQRTRWLALPSDCRIGRLEAIPSWLLPIQVHKPFVMVAALRRHGFDASSQASGIIDLCRVGADDLCASRLVFLPTSGPIVDQTVLASHVSRPTPSRP
jgi:perosamine synthetase